MNPEVLALSKVIGIVQMTYDLPDYG